MIVDLKKLFLYNYYYERVIYLEEKKSKYKKIIVVLEWIIIAEFVFFPVYFVLVAIFNNSSNNNCSAQNMFKQEQIDEFNGRFESYIGDKKSKSDVQTLIIVVIASNEAQKKVEPPKNILINNILERDELYNLSEMYSNNSSDLTYSIKAIYDDETGYINNIIITEETK